MSDNARVIHEYLDRIETYVAGAEPCAATTADAPSPPATDRKDNNPSEPLEEGELEALRTTVSKYELHTTTLQEQLDEMRMGADELLIKSNALRAENVALLKELAQLREEKRLWTVASAATSSSEPLPPGASTKDPEEAAASPTTETKNTVKDEAPPGRSPSTPPPIISSALRNGLSSADWERLEAWVDAMKTLAKPTDDSSWLCAVIPGVDDAQQTVAYLSIRNHSGSSHGLDEPEPQPPAGNNNNKAAPPHAKGPSAPVLRSAAARHITPVRATTTGPKPIGGTPPAASTALVVRSGSPMARTRGTSPAATRTAPGGAQAAATLAASPTAAAARPVISRGTAKVGRATTPPASTQPRAATSPAPVRTAAGAAGGATVARKPSNSPGPSRGTISSSAAKPAGTTTPTTGQRTTSPAVVRRGPPTATTATATSTVTAQRRMASPQRHLTASQQHSGSTTPTTSAAAGASAGSGKVPVSSSHQLLAKRNAAAGKSTSSTTATGAPPAADPKQP